MADCLVIDLCDITEKQTKTQNMSNITCYYQNAKENTLERLHKNKDFTV